MPSLPPPAPTSHDTAQRLVDWYARHARVLPWRDPAVTPWGVLVSEVMLAQTPVARVVPVWPDWMARWPTPTDLAAADTAELLRAWGRLGYPRRALRLQQAAARMVEDHAGRVPDDLDELLALPGVGAYTARAVLAFAFGRRQPVVDTNVRRVLARLVDGQGAAGPPAPARDHAAAVALLPEDESEAAVVSIALMELGALVCTAANPACTRCPVAEQCAWLAAGRPAYDGPRVRPQRFAGTDRQVRGRLMEVLRAGPDAVPADRLDLVWPDAEQRTRALAALVRDGLAVHRPDGRYALPGSVADHRPASTRGSA